MLLVGNLFFTSHKVGAIGSSFQSQGKRTLHLRLLLNALHRSSIREIVVI